MSWGGGGTLIACPPLGRALGGIWGMRGMSGHVMRAVTVTGLATAMVFVGATGAMAGPRTPGSAWEKVRTSSNLLAVYMDNQRRGDAVINYRLANLSTGLRSQSAWKLKDTRQDGNLVHGAMTTMENTGLCYAPQYTSCSQQYYKGGAAETPGWGGVTRSNWMYIHTGVAQEGTFARLSGKMCVTQAYWPDHCDGYAVSTGWQY